MGKNKKYFIETYGCEMNKSDSVDIALSFENKGYEKADSEKEADIVVLNTCAVRENAEERIFGRLGYYRSLRKVDGKNPRIVLAGCMAQERAGDVVRIFPEINVVAGTYHGLDIPRFIEAIEIENSAVVAVDKKNFQFSRYKGKRAEGYKAWVNIIKGCSNYCSYCIVPYLRGPETSKPSDEIIEEVKALADNGVVEITLLGQNVNAYGKDNKDISFTKLLEKIHRIDGIQWIRFLTSHPKDFNREIVKRISDLPKLCKHIHLPVQSGSDRILTLMNRKYTIRHYGNIIDAIRKYIPDCSITTDLIVGFPTESDTDFRKTLDIVKTLQYDDAFTYRYSKRPFTKAAELSDFVEPEVGKKRLKELIELQRSISFEKNKMEIGRCFRALVERKSKKDISELLCKTEKGKMAVVKTDASAGSFIQVMINGISGNTLRGVEVG